MLCGWGCSTPQSGNNTSAFLHEFPTFIYDQKLKDTYVEALSYLLQEEADSAIRYFEKLEVLALAQENEKTKLLATWGMQEAYNLVDRLPKSPQEETLLQLHYEAIAARQQGEMELAAQKAEQSLKAFEVYFQDESIPLLACLHYWLGDIYLNEMYEETPALRHLEEALVMHIKWIAKPTKAMAMYLHKAGRSCTELGMYKGGIDYQEQALSLRKRFWGNSSMKAANSYSELGINYYYTNNFESAKSVYQQAVDISTAYQVQFPIYYLLYNLDLGTSYDMLEKGDSAVYFLQKALTFRNEFQPDEWSFSIAIFQNLALYYTKQNEWEAAESTLKEAIQNRAQFEEEAPWDLAFLYDIYGYWYSQQGLWESALNWYQKGLQQHEPSLESQNWEQPPQLDHWQDWDDPEGFLALLLGKGNALANLKDGSGKALSLALQHYELYFSLIDSLNSQTLTDADKLDATKQAVPHLAEALEVCYQLWQQDSSPNHLDRAFGLMERNKANLLLEAFLRNNKKPEEEARIDSLRTKIKESLTRLVELENTQNGLTPEDRFELSNQLLLLRSELKKQSSEDSTFRFETKAQLSVKVLQQYLPDDSSLWLEYLATDTSLWAMAISKQQVHLLPLPFGKVLQQQLKRWNHWTASSPYETTRKDLEEMQVIGHQLFEAWLQPLLLPQSQRLMIIPDGPLTQLAFESLLTQKTSTADLADWPFAIQKYDMAYGLAASIVLVEKNQVSDRDDMHMLAYSFSAFDGEQLEPPIGQTRSELLADLPYAAREVEMLKKRFQGKFRFAENASKTHFLQEAPEHDIIHLALHGVIKNGTPLLLFPAAKETEKLYPHELEDLNLQAHLVVLSACQTAQGRFEQGEGQLHMARAFAMQGCPQIICTQWSVDDASTSAIMDHFYTNYQKDLPVTTALSRAKRTFFSQAAGLQRHPAFWAGVVVLGGDV